MSTNESRSDLFRQLWFSRQVHDKRWKDVMAGKNEERVLLVLDALGYKQGVDYERQYPVAERYVLDFAFVKERVALEVDGKNHVGAKAIRKDKIRDRYLRTGSWVTIRIKDEHLFGSKASFYKYLIDEVVKERRDQWERGVFYPFDFSRFNENDYE